MPWLYATVIGILAGLAVGYVAERVPIAPVLQSLAAALTAIVLGAVVMAVVWFLRPGGLGAVFYGFALGSLWSVGGFCVVIVALHMALGLVGGTAPALANHRAMVLGCLGGLCGALPVAWAMVASSRWT